MMESKRMPKAITCKKCGNEWLEEIKITKFDGEMIVSIEQPTVSVSSAFYAYKCHICNTLNPPKVFMNTFDQVRKDHDEFRDAIEKPIEEN